MMTATLLAGFLFAFAAETKKEMHCPHLLTLNS
jgi:hypothetical protein